MFASYQMPKKKRKCTRNNKFITLLSEFRNFCRVSIFSTRFFLKTEIVYIVLDEIELRLMLTLFKDLQY